MVFEKKNIFAKDVMMVVGKSHTVQSKSYCGLTRFVGLFFTTRCDVVALLFFFLSDYSIDAFVLLLVVSHFSKFHFQVDGWESFGYIKK